MSLKVERKLFCTFMLDLIEFLEQKWGKNCQTMSMIINIFFEYFPKFIMAARFFTP